MTGKTVVGGSLAASGRTPDGTVHDVTGHGPEVVLVHGLGLNRHSWQWTVPALARRYRVITYDLLGHGESDKPTEAPSLRLLSRQLVALLDDLGVAQAAVLGFSLGGMIARRFAMDHGNRLWALGILHSAHRRSPAAQAAVEARARQAADEGPQSTVEAALERWFTDRFRATHPETMDLVRCWVTANRKEIYAPLYHVLASGVDELLAPDPPIAMPALVMTADHDYGNSPEMSAAIALEITGAKLVVLDGLRHMALAEAPELFNAELVGFLDSARPDR